MTNEQEAKNRWSEIHQNKKAAKKKRGWQGRRGAPGVPGEARFGSLGGEALCGELSLDNDQVAVCIPVIEGVDEDLLAKSVSSLLDGKHENVQIILVSEGLVATAAELLPEELTESPRVFSVHFDGDAAGAFHSKFGDAIRHTRANYIAFQGPHDTSDPDRLADQVAALIETGSDACFVPARDPGGSPIPVGTALTVGFGELAPATGLFRRELFDKLGGLYPGRGGLRLLHNAVALLGRVVATKHSLYVRRDTLLADSPDADATSVWEAVLAAAGTSMGTAVQEMKSHNLRSRDRRAPSEPWAELDSASAPTPTAETLRAVLTSMPNSSSATRSAEIQLFDELASRRPDRVLVVGTLLAALAASLYAKLNPTAAVRVLEQDKGTAEEIADALGAGNAHSVQVIHALVVEHLVEPQGYQWYSFDPEDLFDGKTVDFMYLAGPRGAPRNGALLHLAPILRPGTVVQCVDDPDFAATLAKWVAHTEPCFALASVPTADPRVETLEVAPHPDSAEGIVVTVLTGGRPKLLRRTLRTLRASDPELVEAATFHVLVNGGDAETIKVLEGLNWIDHVHTTDGPPLPVPEAMSKLMAHVSEDARFVLHLEDDWECKGEGWRQRAVALLTDADRPVAQVWLDAAATPSSRSINAGTGRHVEWKDGRSKHGFRFRTAEAGLTLRPSLVAAATVRALWPSETELEAREKFQAQEGRVVARLEHSPFQHIGADHSLKKKLGRGS